MSAGVTARPAAISRRGLEMRDAALTAELDGTVRIWPSRNRETTCAYLPRWFTRQVSHSGPSPIRLNSSALSNARG